MIRRQELDFEILRTTNEKTLVFADASSYFEDPDRPILQVIPPGYTKYTVANIVARRLNTLNSHTLGLSQGYETSELKALPDGLWTFTFRICPYDKLYRTKYHLRTVALREKLSRITDFLPIEDCGDCEAVKRSVADILLLLWSGELAADLGKASRATDFYQRALKLSTKVFTQLFDNV